MSITKKKIIFLFSIFLMLGILSPKVMAAEKASVVMTSDDFSFGQEVTALKENDSKRGGVSSHSAYASKRLIVKMKKSLKDCRTFFEAYDVKKIVVGPDKLYALQFESAQATKAAKVALDKLDSIQYVEPAYLCRASVEKNTLSKGRTSVMSWGVFRIGANEFAKQVQQATSMTTLKVAVIDSGVARNPVLIPRLLNDGYNFIDNTSNTEDHFGHGTHVAGTVFDTTEPLKVKILPVKVLNDKGDGDTFALVNGIKYAVKKGAKVINISINLESDTPGTTAHSPYLEDAIKEAVRKGVVVVVSAGNEGINAKHACPAELTEAIVVGAVNDNDTRAPFSNFGDSVDVMAPGVDILSTLPSGSGYMTGTSMAAPHVTGLAAMLKIMYPSASPLWIENKIKSNTDHDGKLSNKEWYGAGIPNFKKIQTHAAKSIALSKSSQTIVATKTATLKATVSPQNAVIRTVRWVSSDEKVAKVKNGVVIGVAPGTARISAKTANGKVAYCNVTVKAAPQLPRTYFDLQSYHANTQKAVINVKEFKQSKGIQVELQDMHKKTIASMMTEDKTCTFSGLESQKIYYYRARAYYDIGNITVYGTWSYRRVFSTAKVTVKKTAEKKGVHLLIPKVSGVKKFNVYFSTTNKAGSFQKIKTMLPGQSFYYSSFKGTPLEKYGTTRTFYVLLKPIYEKKETSDSKFVRTQFKLR